MLGLPKGSDFIVQFDDRFLYDSVKERFAPYFDQKNFIFQSLTDYLNATVMGINFDGINASSNNTQTKGKESKVTKYRTGLPSKERIDKTITITFQLKKAFLNWFILNDQLSQYVDTINTPNTPDTGNDTFLTPITVFILDDDGNIAFERIYRGIVMESITDLTLNKTDNKIGKKEFSVTFSYSDWNIKYNIVDKVNQVKREYSY